MFCSQEDLNQILRGNVDVLNRVLEEVSVKTTEATLRSIPVMIGKLLQITSTTQDLVKSVYQNNPEFANYKELVVLTIHEVESQNPGLDFQHVIDKSVPVIKDKIKEYDNLVKTTVNNPSAQEIASRLNGAI